MCLLWRSPLPVTSHASDAAAAPWGGDPVLFRFMPSVGVKYRFAEYGSQPEAGTGPGHSLGQKPPSTHGGLSVSPHRRRQESPRL